MQLMALKSSVSRHMASLPSGFPLITSELTQSASLSTTGAMIPWSTIFWSSFSNLHLQARAIFLTG